ncbi:MAG: DsbE family thiol:disulfide interchange protein [Gammaproteobacteria bacterium]|nr:DsbE family thiol:disulfide interchange protein [Gammaproteobacteria bacterium]
MWRFTLPLMGFGLLVLILAIGLTQDPSEVPSPLIGKPAPEFELPRLHDPSQNLSLADLKGEITLLNVWASWCESCRVEHPFISEIAASGAVAVYGLNYKDERGEALKWLKALGDPYQAIAVDQDGRVAIDFGVYGAPESYLLDQNGVIVYKKIGPITARDWKEDVSPLIQQLRDKQL